MVASKSRWVALGALALGTLAVGLDTTILSVALPTLSRDLSATTADLQWFTNAYLLVLAAGLLPAGMLGDRFGRKRMLLLALLVFGAASALCAFAGTSGQLTAARAVLGLGSAMIMPLSAAVLTVLFDEQERKRALGVWVTANALGIPLGPLLGGWLLDHFRWGSVFLINVPLVVLAMTAVALWVPESHGDRARRFDPLGVLLSAGGLTSLTYGIIEAGARGWSDARSLAAITTGAVLLAAFVWWQRRAAAPLVDLALFRSRAFAGGALLATVGSFAMLGLLFGLPQYFSGILGADAFGAGLRLLTVIGGLLVGARIAGRLGARTAIPLGLALMGLAMLAGSRTGVDTAYGYVAAWTAVAGVGVGFTLPPAMNLAMGALTVERSGVGNGLLQAVRQVGGAIGVAITGTVLTGAYRDALPDAAGERVRESAASGLAAAARLGDPALAADVRSAFVAGMDASLLVSAAVALAGAVLALVVLPRAAAPAAPPALAESGV